MLIRTDCALLHRKMVNQAVRHFVFPADLEQRQMQKWVTALQC